VRHKLVGARDKAEFEKLVKPLLEPETEAKPQPKKEPQVF